MSEIVINNIENSDPVKDAVNQVSAGALLRNAREASGLHIAALAVSLKVPVAKLEALESDRYDLLPDTVFARALAATVCRNLKIDPVQVLKKMPQTATPELKSDESGVNTPFRDSGRGPSFALLNQFSKPAVWAILALLLGMLVLVFVPLKQLADLVNFQKLDTSQVNVPVAKSALETKTTQGQVVTELALPALGQSSSGAVSSMSSGTVGVLTEPSQIQTTEAQKNAVASSATTGTVVFRARGVSWVEVIDATGAVQVRKTMAEGESVTASGVLPLAVVVGHVSNMDAQVRGQPFDLTSVAKDNVARFEVK